MVKYIKNLLKPEPNKSTARILLEGIPFLLITMFAFIGLLTVLIFGYKQITWLNSEEKTNEDKMAFDFDKRFVVYNKNTNGYGTQIRLDLQTGCLYNENGGNLSVLFKNSKEADCDQNYIGKFNKRFNLGLQK